MDAKYVLIALALLCGLGSIKVDGNASHEMIKLKYKSNGVHAMYFDVYKNDFTFNDIYINTKDNKSFKDHDKKILDLSVIPIGNMKVLKKNRIVYITKTGNEQDIIINMNVSDAYFIQMLKLPQNVLYDNPNNPQPGELIKELTEIYHNNSENYLTEKIVISVLALMIFLILILIGCIIFKYGNLKKNKNYNLILNTIS